jgi:NCK-associated protein 1
MAKTAEKLIILGDIAQGLLARVYNLSAFKRDPLLFTVDVDKHYVKLLLKKFPDLTDPKPGENKGFDLFKKNSQAITQNLADFYLTFNDLLNFNEETFKVLTEISQTQQEFKPEVNIDLLSYYLNLFVRYVQLQLLVTQIDLPQINIAAYAKAYHMTSGNTEPNFGRIVKYLTDRNILANAEKENKQTPTQNSKHMKDCIRKLQEECAGIALSIGATLQGLSSSVHKWLTTGTKAFLDNHVFALTEDPRVMTQAQNEKIHLDLLNLDKIKQWIQYGYLICPSELSRPGSVEALLKCLKDGFILPIYRDRYINHHELYEDLFDNYKKDKFKLKKEQKKLLKDTQSDWPATLRYHQELRTLFRVELQSAIQFFTEFPHCISPKIQHIFALLHLSRDEILWYIKHQNYEKYVPFHNAKKYQWVADWQLSTLINQIDVLSNIVRRSSQSVKTYYMEYLKGLDSARLSNAVNSFYSSVQASGHIPELIDAVVNSLPSRSLDDNFEAIRLNWYRISCALNATQSGIGHHHSAGLAAAMNFIVIHSRNIDCIETQLKSHASLQLVYFHKPEFIQQFKLCLGAKDGQQVNAAVFVKLLNEALYNVHRICPEEQATIGKDVVTLADHFLADIVQNIESNVQVIVHETEELRKETSAQAVLNRLIDPAQAQQPVPGVESQFANRAALQKLRFARKSVADFCEGLYNNPTITVYNLQFLPRQYLHESVINSLRQYLRLIAMPSGSFQRPTVIIQRYKDIVSAYQQIEKHLNLSISDAVRDIFITEFNCEDSVLDISLTKIEAPNVVSPKTEGSADAKTEEEKKATEHAANKQLPIIHTIAVFYYNIFSHELSDAGIIYSPLRKCFMSRKDWAVDKQKQQELQAQGLLISDFERYTDVVELRALAQLCGPAGFRLIDRALLRIVAVHVKNIKECVQANQIGLLALSTRFTEIELWREHVSHVQGLDNLVYHTTLIGCVLQLRELLRDAQYEVHHTRSTYIQKALKLAHNQIHTRVVNDPLFLHFDNLCYDTGIALNEADHNLRNALSKLKTGLPDLQLFQLLPELYGLSFISNRWRSSKYTIDYEGFLSNLHCGAIAIRHLIAAFNRVALKESGVTNAQGDLEKKIQQDFERFIRCSAYSILHMHADNTDPDRHKEKQHLSYNINNPMTFLELFIRNSGGRLNVQMLESCLPFTMLRTNYIQTYEKQGGEQFSVYAAADEEKE